MQTSVSKQRAWHQHQQQQQQQQQQLLYQHHPQVQQPCRQHPLQQQLLHRFNRSSTVSMAHAVNMQQLQPFCNSIHTRCAQQQQQQQQTQRQQMQRHRARCRIVTPAAAADAFGGSSKQQQQQQQQHEGHQPGPKAIPPRIQATATEETYSLRDTQVLVETAMLSAVSGLAFLVSTLLKLDNSLGYFLPLPITIAACRSGVAAGWHTMMATAFLLLVLLGPLRAITYVLMHGILAASLGSMWIWKWPWALSIMAGAVLRMAGQLGYLVLSSVTMNENLFQVMLANVHNLLDQVSAALGSSGSPSTLAITCMIFALLLVNGICYVFLLHVVYHVILSFMGFKLGALPGFVRKYLYAGLPQQQQQPQ